MGRELTTNEKTELHVMEDADFTDWELVYHVRDILDSALQGDNEKYSGLVRILHHKQHLDSDEVALLVTSLKSLSGAVSYIDCVRHEALLFAILGMSMWNYGPDVMDALLELIISLAATNAKCMDMCLCMLVKNFLPPHYYLNVLKEPRGLARKDQVVSRLHAALKDIIDLVPLAPMRLSPIVIHYLTLVINRESDASINIYVQNMLRLANGSIKEIIEGTVLPALVDKMIELDVEIGWDDLSEEDSKGIFEMELEDVNVVADKDLKDNTELLGDSLLQRSLKGNAASDKLDSLMVLAFEYLESCQSNKRLDKVFDILLASFRKTVLTTYKSKFTQFVMFYACALDPEEFGVKFAMMLADLFVHDDKNLQIRMSAVAYLASYLSRAKFLSLSLVASLLRRLVDWCFTYCQSHNVKMNPSTHQVYYSGCQAFMYILCFKMRSLMDVPRLKLEIRHMPIELILMHKLNPLKVCLPTVVTEFLRQAKAACLFSTSDSFSLSDTMESEHSRAFGGMDRLDMFFPFDPCLLRQCERFIRPHFTYWSMVRTDYEDETNSSDEDEAEDFTVDVNEDTDDDGMMNSLDDEEFDVNEFDFVLNKMSITPKNSIKNMRMPSRIRPSTSPESL